MKHILTLAFIAFGFIANAQKADQFLAWYTYSGNHKIADKYKIHTLLSERRADGLVADQQQQLIRGVVIRELSKKVDIGIGYDYARTYPYGEQPIADIVNEHRLTERIVVKQKLFKKLGIKHRYLFEHRFVKDRDTSHRLRYTLGASYPVLKSNDNTLLATAGNEAFLLLNNPNVFNQNWLSGGFKYKFDSNKAVSLGYRNMYLVKNPGVKMENNHILLTGFSWDLDLTK